jgi:transposase
MKRFVLGVDRVQSTLLPGCLDDFIDESNPVRAIDAFVDALDLAELGFDGVSPAATGRPSYHPSVLMKTLPKVAAEMALSVLAYNLTRVINILGTRPLIAAIRA